MGIRQNILDTLASEHVRWVNFTFANRLISPIIFYGLATCILSNRVRCKVDRKLTNRAEYDPVDDIISAGDDRYGERFWDEKSVLIHECAHATLDCLYAGSDMSGVASSMTVLNDETIGYLAGAIYLLAAQPGPSPGKPGEPSFEASKAARPKLKALMAKPWSGTETMAFTVQDVADLQSAIKKHNFYSTTYTKTATHDGMKRDGPAPGYVE